MRVQGKEQVAYHEICRIFVVDEDKVFLLSELHTTLYNGTSSDREGKEAAVPV